MDSHRSWHQDSSELDLESAAVHALSSLHKGARGIVSEIRERGESAAAFGDVAGSTMVRRLMELGFVPGEPIEIIEEFRPGGDPIAVRVGGSMFALRRREAQAVRVRLTPSRG